MPLKATTVRFPLGVLIAACFFAGLTASTARATVQEESCIEPDIEYPVPCDDDDD